MLSNALSTDVVMAIEDLKSEDPLLKINAIDKLGLIADSLSTSRVEDELIPYLSFIVNETDTEDEFLVRLSDNLLSYLQRNEQVSKHKALLIFEPLAVMEDLHVRQSAVKGLAYIAQHCLPEIMEVVFHLVSFNVPAKLSALELLNCLITLKAYDNKVVSDIEKLAIVLFSDKVIAVKRAALRLFAVLWEHKGLIQSVLKTSHMQSLNPVIIQSIYVLFETDTSESLLFELLDCKFFKAFVSVLESAQAAVLFDKLVGALTKPQVSWQLKYMVLSNHLVFQSQVRLPVKLTELFTRLLREEQPELKCAVLREMAELYTDKTCTRTIGQFHEAMAEVVRSEVAKDKNTYVAGNFVKLLQSMLVNETKQEGITGFAVELFCQSFEGLVSDSKVTGVELIEVLFCTHDFKRSSEVLGKLETIVSQKNWKMRMGLLEKMQNVMRVLGGGLKDGGNDHKQVREFMEKCLELQMRFSNDHVLVIRKQLMENLLSCRGLVESVKLGRHVEHLMGTWVDSKNYIFRITALQSLVRVQEVFGWKDTAELAAKLVRKTKADKVPNVKINLIKMLLQLKGGVEEVAFRKMAREVIEANEGEADRDVRMLTDELKGVVE